MCVMKKISICLILLSSLILTSCGTTASYTDSRTIQDAIYYNPDYASIKAATEAEQNHIAQLTSQTKASKIYSEPADTIVLGETRNVTIPLEPEKTYVVLLEGETYEDRFNKFEEGSDRTFSINFEYNFGYGYDWGWNPYYYHHSPSYYRWHTPSYYWGWYDPWYSPWYGYGPHYYYYSGWYDPWYYPGFYPGYYAGYYPPYYDPWYGPMYPPMYLPIAPGPGGVGHKDVVHGRREIARATPAAAPASHRESVRRAPAQQSISQVRGNNTDNRSQTTASSTQRRGVKDAKQGNTSDKYRQSATQTQKGATRSSSSYNNSSTQRYQSSQGQSSRSTYNQNRNNSYSGRSSSYNSGSSYRSSGNTSGGGSSRTGGRR